MYKKALLKLLFFILPFTTQAQYVWDFGGSLGASSFLSDVGGKDTPAKKFIGDLNMPSTRIGLGFFARYKLSPLLSFQASAAWDQVSGDDKNNTYLPRKGRNLSVRNNLFELALTTQVYFYEVPGLVQTFKTNVDFRAYVFGGISVFHHNPQTQYNGQWVDLRPLMTEGAPYSLLGMAIPFGIGSYFSYNRMHRIGFEICWRKTFTDYLDDVSDRYVDPSTLPNATAVALNDRSGEVEVQQSPEFITEVGQDVKLYGYDHNSKQGSIRGDPKKMDTWFTYSLTYSYAIRGKSSFYRSRYPGLFGKKNKKRKIRAKF